MVIQERIKQEIKELFEIRNEYEKLNKKCRYEYNYRQMAIEGEIEVLQNILEGTSTASKWKECLKEDSRDY